MRDWDLYYSKEEQSYILNNFNMLSDLKIAKNLNKGEKYVAEAIRIKQFCLFKGLNKRFQFKEFDQDFFETINTEEKAYIYGFFVGDGSVKRDDYAYISVHKKDVDILEKIKIALKGKQEIRESEEQKILYFSSRKFAGDLIKLGVIPNKSNINILPLLKIPEGELFHHFVRGLVDSDGGFGVTNKGKLRAGYICQGLKNKDLVDFIYLKLKIGKCYLNKTARTYSLLITRQEDIKKFIKFLYEEVNFYLERKYLLARGGGVLSTG